MKVPTYNKIKLKYLESRERLQPVFKKPKVQAYSMLILSFFTMAFFGFFAIRPTLRTIAQLNREIQDSRELDSKLTKKINDLALIQADYELIRGALPALSTALPGTADFAQLVYALEEVSRVSQASISALTFSSISLASASAQPQESKEPTEMAFKLAMTGTYDQLIQAFRFLTNNRRIIRFDGVSFAVKQEQPSTVEMTVAFQAKSFYY